MASQDDKDTDLVPVVLSDRSDEHNYAKPPPASALLTPTTPSIDLTDLLAMNAPESVEIQGMGEVPTAGENFVMSDDWLASLYDQGQQHNDLSLDVHAFPSAQTAAKAACLVNDPFLGSTPLDSLMDDLDATLAMEGGQHGDPELANWLRDMISETPRAQPVPSPYQSAASHGSPSSDRGYDSHGSVASPGSSSDSDDRSQDIAYSSTSQYTPYKDANFCEAGGKMPRRGGRASTVLPGITFEELERIKLSGPTAFSSSAQVFWQPGGEFKLTADEIEALEQERLPIPVGLPMKTVEEKALKHVRRKIKNKICAQESRRKRKEYVEGLEKRIHACTNTNGQLQKRVQSLEAQNQTLMNQLTELQKQVSQSLLAASSARPSARMGLLVLVLCFALVLPFAPGPGNLHVHMPWSQIAAQSAQPTAASPQSATPYDYTTKFRSRVLLHTPDPESSLESPPLKNAVLPSSAPPSVHETNLLSPTSTDAPVLARSSRGRRLPHA